MRKFWWVGVVVVSLALSWLMPIIYNSLYYSKWSLLTFNPFYPRELFSGLVYALGVSMLVQAWSFLSRIPFSRQKTNDSFVLVSIAGTLLLILIGTITYLGLEYDLKHVLSWSFLKNVGSFSFFLANLIISFIASFAGFFLGRVKISSPGAEIPKS